MVAQKPESVSKTSGPQLGLTGVGPAGAFDAGATGAKTGADLIIPMSVRDIYEAMLDQGITKGAAFGLLSIFGHSLQVYESEQGEGKK